MLDKLASIEAKYSQIEARLAAPETYDDPAQVARLNKEQNELSPVVETYRAYLRAREREQEAGALLSDPELRELAQEEQQQARQDHNHRRHRGDPRQLRGDDRQHNHKQDKERQIDDGGNGGGGDHLADLLQLAQLGDKAAGGARNGAVA